MVFIGDRIPDGQQLLDGLLGIDFGKIGAHDEKERNKQRNRDKKRVPWKRGGHGKRIIDRKI
jgi:hypothetical protein